MPKLQTHTVEQPASDITTFILSCNRLHLLKPTIESFRRTADLPTKVIILDDSGVPEVFDQLVQLYGDWADIICFPENRGLWWAKDFMVSYCFTPYIFYLEDDWVFLGSGYLQASKSILERHRDIGSIDISWRTFEDEGLDSYEPELIENQFYYKKPWQITPNHLHWFIWQNSPTLRRRDDMILLGRIEKYYNEWNIDRKFYALGFRGCYLAGRYVRHIGDNDSLMVNKRPHEHTTPETLFPEELRARRLLPAFDYYGLDAHAREVRGHGPIHRNPERVLVTALVNINREEVDGRNFVSHYVGGVLQLVRQGLPIVIYCDPSCYDMLCGLTGGLPSAVFVRSLEDVRSLWHYPRVQAICASEQWIGQADWMRTSIIRSPDYIALTYYKLELLRHAAESQLFKGQNFYWVDAGMCSSYNIPDLQQYDLHKLKTGKITISTFPYTANPEIHGYNREGYLENCGKVPDRVGRATIFGGATEQINILCAEFNRFLGWSLSRGYVGTEEAILSGLLIKLPQLFDEYPMHSGDIRNFLATMPR